MIMSSDRTRNGQDFPQPTRETARNRSKVAENIALTVAVVAACLSAVTTMAVAG